MPCEKRLGANRASQQPCGTGRRPDQRRALESASSLDEQLAAEMSRVFIQLAQSQRELDPESKRVLYQNRHEFYVR